MDDFSICRGIFDLCLDNLAKILHRCEEVKLEKVSFHGTRRCSFGACGFKKGH